MKYSWNVREIFLKYFGIIWGAFTKYYFILDFAQDTPTHLGAQLGCADVPGIRFWSPTWDINLVVV